MAFTDGANLIFARDGCCDGIRDGENWKTGEKGTGGGQGNTFFSYRF